MTIEDFITNITLYQDYVLFFFLGMPLLTIIYGFLHEKDRASLCRTGTCSRPGKCVISMLDIIQVPIPRQINKDRFCKVRRKK